LARCARLWISASTSNEKDHKAGTTPSDPPEVEPLSGDTNAIDVSHGEEASSFDELVRLLEEKHSAIPIPRLAAKKIWKDVLKTPAMRLFLPPSRQPLSHWGPLGFIPMRRHAAP
jgi:hypothetical protein